MMYKEKKTFVVIYQSPVMDNEILKMGNFAYITDDLSKATKFYDDKNVEDVFNEIRSFDENLPNLALKRNQFLPGDFEMKEVEIKYVLKE